MPKNIARLSSLIALMMLLLALSACAAGQAGTQGSLADPAPAATPVPPVQPASGRHAQHQMATPVVAPPPAQAADKPAAMECPMMKQMGQQPGGPAHQGHGAAQPGQPGAPMTCPMMQQMMGGHGDHGQLHKGMGHAHGSGNPDRDFLSGMIAHHQGAIARAKVVLTQGKDPKVKKLARQVIAANEKEIVKMKAWLAKRTDKKALPEAQSAPAADRQVPAPGGHGGH